MSAEIREVLQWWKSYDGKKILIKSDSIQFNVCISVAQIPHLLGLQYTRSNREKKLTGKTLFNSCIVKEDEEIYALISRKNPNMVLSVKNRVRTLKLFMCNILEGYIVENTNLNSQISCQHFIVQNCHNEILQLGVFHDNKGNSSVNNYKVFDKKLQTYIVNRRENYYRGTMVNERIYSVECYNVQGQLEPFRFE